MKKIGILACSAEGAALCYRTICTEGARLLGAAIHPEIALHSHSLADYVTCINRGDWAGVGEIMLDSAHKLSCAGAEFLICPDNTIHQALSHINHRLPLPLLHIADVVATEAARHGYRCLGLSGTHWLVESEVYPEQLSHHQINYLRPTRQERTEMGRIIMEELVYGIFKPEAISFFQSVYTRMKDQGCDAVVLGCTEIPLIINDDNSPLPILDSTRLLAYAALRHATASFT